MRQVATAMQNQCVVSEAQRSVLLCVRRGAERVMAAAAARNAMHHRALQYINKADSAADLDHYRCVSQGFCTPNAPLRLSLPVGST
jgi:hypothetical protein